MGVAGAGAVLEIVTALACPQLMLLSSHALHLRLALQATVLEIIVTARAVALAYPQLCFSLLMPFPRQLASRCMLRPTTAALRLASFSWRRNAKVNS